MDLRTIPAKYADPDPKLISKLPKGGVQLEFVGHADLTLMLIDIDPEWNWEPLALTSDGLPLIKQNGKTLSMWGKLKVLGKTIIGVGTCQEGKQDPEKELIGDFLRNASMRFGFCTKLWSKTDAMPGDPVPDHDADLPTPEDLKAEMRRTLATDWSAHIRWLMETGSARQYDSKTKPDQLDERDLLRLYKRLCDLPTPTDFDITIAKLRAAKSIADLDNVAHGMTLVQWTEEHGAALDQMYNECKGRLTK